MTKIKALVFLSIIVAGFAACSSDSYKKTASGIMYKITSDGKAPLVKRGDILKLHYTQKMNDSLMQSSYGSVPAYLKVDSIGPVYNPLEVLPMLRKGDSVVILQLADTIMKRLQPGQAEQMKIKKGDKLYLTFKIVEVFNSDETAQADNMKEMKEEGDRAPKALDDYIASKKIQAQKSPNGVYVVVTNPGSGDNVDSGKYVSVTYTGKSLPSEKVFESNAGSAPYQFTIGNGEVIPGWEDGLKMLKKGGKATFYIPANMAYGQRPGPGGKPFENLIFDVELVDVAAKAPAPPPAPTMPNTQGMPQQGQAPPR